MVITASFLYIISVFAMICDINSDSSFSINCLCLLQT